MRRVMIVAAAIVLGVALTGTSALAQKNAKNPKPNKKKVRQPRVIRGGLQLVPGRVARTRANGPNPLIALRNQKIQEDLKLDNDQIEEVKEAYQEVSKARRGIFQKLRGLKPEERQKKMQESMKKFNTDSAAKAKEILDDKQYARLQQIMVQMQGTRALQNPEIQKKLKVTEDQTKKIADVQKSVQEKRRKIMQDLRANGGRIDFKKFREKTQELNKQIEKNTLEVLTKEQREQFEKMKGKKIDLGRGRGLRAVPGIGVPRIQIKRLPAGKIRKIQRKAVKPRKARKNKNKKDADKAEDK